MSKIFDKGYNILDIPENWSFDGENVNEYEELLFDDNWYWKCKIQKNVKNEAKMAEEIYISFDGF